MAQAPCPTSYADITVIRMCGEDRQQLRPVYLQLQECYNVTIDEEFSEILLQIQNQVSL